VVTLDAFRILSRSSTATQSPIPSEDVYSGVLLTSFRHAEDA
jgi:hypothetical protein